MADSTSTLTFASLLTLILCFIFPPTATCSGNQTDLLSLLALKYGLKDPLGALNSWNQTAHFCRWNGIQCGHRHRDRVVGINLTSQGLIGSLSPHLGNLSFLRSIILTNNSLYGQIPQQISRIRGLETVNFSYNSFVGPIPRNLSNCPNLVYLNLIRNELSGNIPAELYTMSKLIVLYLSKNNLSGSIPPSIGNMTSLTKLSLASCGLQGEIPESLARLPSLIFLQLSDNHLTGVVPSALFNISTLQFLGFANNHLHGVIPSSIGLTLPDLRQLDLWGNQFEGPIPLANISNASFLRGLDVSQNYFTGPMPVLGSLPHLNLFSISSNLIEGDISFISSFTNSTELVNLEVGENLFTGSLPNSIGNLSTRLTALHLYQNKIHGRVPSHIGNLNALTVLYLDENYFGGPFPVTITKLVYLIEFFLSRNRVTNEIPHSIGNLTRLNSLLLDENNLSGNVPTSLANCTNLLDLSLSRNNLSGVIPPEIMKLSSVTIRFSLSYNEFIGSIPFEVGSLVNLESLDLSNNRLSGLIPNSISHCTSLQQLYLRGNLLEGEIPLRLGALMGLQDLDLSRNHLSGQIPSFLGKLKLTYLNLSFNELHGEVPRQGIFMNKTAVFLDGNKQLCGGISELKLPPCSPAQSPKKISSTLIEILIPIVAIGGTCIMLIAFYICKQRMSRKRAAPPSTPSFVDAQFMRLSYGDLFQATAGFSETNLLGFGRYGSVYKGILEDGRTLVAVKVFNLFVRGASKSFMVECNVLRNIRHKNLLKILSACESIDFQGNDFKALVYEFKANGSLENLLYQSREGEGTQSTKTNQLDMIQRLNIAIDIAQAMEYLHFGTDSCIVHGDLKPSNILLDNDMMACVGDFGLAKIVSYIDPPHESSSSIAIRGTIGYVAPEYGTAHSVSTEGDVYSYGIVLLEIFLIKKPTDELFTDHVSFHNFVNAALPDQVMDIVDPRLQRGLHDINDDDKIKDCMAAILSIGLSCSKEAPKDRMLMKDVVNELCKIRKLLYG